VPVLEGTWRPVRRSSTPTTGWSRSGTWSRRSRRTG